MAYTPFDPTKPDASSQAGTAFGNSTKYNLLAARDGAVMAGTMPGWGMVSSGGTADQPALLTYTSPSGTEKIKAALTWGTTGGENGKVTQQVWSYSSDSGGTWALMVTANGKKTISYTSAGNVSGWSWS